MVRRGCILTVIIRCRLLVIIIGWWLVVVIRSWFLVVVIWWWILVIVICIWLLIIIICIWWLRLVITCLIWHIYLLTSVITFIVVKVRIFTSWLFANQHCLSLVTWAVKIIIIKLESNAFLYALLINLFISLRTCTVTLLPDLSRWTVTNKLLLTAWFIVHDNVSIFTFTCSLSCWNLCIETFLPPVIVTPVLVEAKDYTVQIFAIIHISSG